MKEIQFVNAEDLESLKTLEGFHIAAFNKGILDEDESETGKTIVWEIHRLLALYKTQLENIMDRTELDEKMVIESLRSMMPNIKIPRKRKYTKKVKDEKDKLVKAVDA